MLASFTNDNLDESSINEFIAPFYDRDAPFSDFVSTYGLKYHCSNYQGQRCGSRTISSPICESFIVFVTVLPGAEL